MVRRSHRVQRHQWHGGAAAVDARDASHRRRSCREHGNVAADCARIAHPSASTWRVAAARDVIVGNGRPELAIAANKGPPSRSGRER
eukprot:6336290-Prymnesium_polylepis.2